MISRIIGRWVDVTVHRCKQLTNGSRGRSILSYFVSLVRLRVRVSLSSGVSCCIGGLSAAFGWVFLDGDTLSASVASREMPHVVRQLPRVLPDRSHKRYSALHKCIYKYILLLLHVGCGPLR